MKPTLLPFDLEIALAHPERVITRNGVKVQYIHKVPLDIKYPLCVILEEDDSAVNYTIEGKFSNVRQETNYDLFLLPETKVEYVIIYDDLECICRTPYLGLAKLYATEYKGFIVKVTYQDNKIIYKEILENI